jgi:nucleoside-diphosphate-sugar epimerase
MKILVTGASGQLGREVVPRLVKRGDTLTLIARDVDKTKKLFPDMDVIHGDIVEKVLGIDADQAMCRKFDALYHLAADINLGTKQQERIWQTNYEGTLNVIDFCKRYNVLRLFYVGTAYTIGRNPYEVSKKAAEKAVDAQNWLFKTVFKPGVIIPCMDIVKPSMGALYQFAWGICTVHERAEIVRRAIEGTLRLPVLVPHFRVKGNPDGHINLVPVDVVADFIAKQELAGKFWLTHPNPPTIQEVLNWMGEAMYVDITVVPEEFKKSAIEAVFTRMAKPFLPYLEGNDFPSDLTACPEINHLFITGSVAQSVIT